MSTRRATLHAVMLIGVFILRGHVAYGVDRTWTGPVSADWFTAGNWSPAGVPAAGDTAIINGGTADLGAADTMVTGFTLNGGTLTGSGALTVSGTMDWAGGVMSGTGTTSVSASGTLAISGGDNKFLDVRTLTNAGSATWSGTGDLYGSSGAVFANTGTF
ncbi:MAG: hypothetical protein HY699_19195, partial [Deltaproteobacteria bacterium]|nr:hypothetical protein [Deltaproteobacteria bacterium]